MQQGFGFGGGGGLCTFEYPRNSGGAPPGYALANDPDGCKKDLFPHIPWCHRAGSDTTPPSSYSVRRLAEWREDRRESYPSPRCGCRSGNAVTGSGTE